MFSAKRRVAKPCVLECYPLGLEFRWCAWWLLFHLVKIDMSECELGRSLQMCKLVGVCAERMTDCIPACIIEVGKSEVEMFTLYIYV